MIVSGFGWISGETCGSLRRGRLQEYTDPKALYQQLAPEGFLTLPPEKVRWLGTGSNRWCLAAALALSDAFENRKEADLIPEQTGVLSLSREGALKANLEYFRDYLASGKKSARGNLFVHTLPTSPMADTAMTFGLKGPLFHLGSSEPKLALLLEQAETLGRESKELSLLCFAASGEVVLCFLLRPAGAAADAGLFSLDQLKSAAGTLWNIEEILEALNTEKDVNHAGA